MKKIMFNDKYGLTQAVLEWRKTMTRRIVSEKLLERAYAGAGMLKYLLLHSTFKAGEVVAVAQSYKDLLDEFGGGGVSPLIAKAGYMNKLFVRAERMPNQIRITSVHIERLRDISDEDCLREGIYREKCRLYPDRDFFYYSDPFLARQVFQDLPEIV